MISSVGVPAVTGPISVPSTSPSTETPTNEASGDGAVSPRGADELSLSPSGSLAVSGGGYQRTSLKIHSHSQVRTTDDGQRLATSHTKLRFNYDFEAADGTKIRIHAVANLNYAQLTDSDAESQSLKLRATAKISILQEGVASDLGSLFGTPEISDDAKTAISTGLDLFRQAMDTATSLFLDSEPVDGDGLIAGAVEAFNGLSDSIGALFEPPAETPSLSSPEAAELPEPPATDSTEVAPAPSEQGEATPPVDAEPEPLPESLPPTAAEVSEPEAAPVEDAGQAEAVAPETAVVPETGEPSEAGQPSEAGDVQNTEPTPTRSLVGAAMFRVRLHVMASLRDLVGVFDSASSGQQTSQSQFRVSAQFIARYSVSGTGVNEALPSVTGLDAHV